MNIRKLNFDTLPSTNDEMRKHLSEDEGLLIISKSQTAGKGRKGRTFYSKEGGVYFSLLLKPALISPSSLFITPAAAVSASLAADALCGKKTQIKWVNDVYLGSRKVCGILTEAVTDREPAVILGVGLNLIKPADGFDGEIENKAGALFEAGDFMELSERFSELFLKNFVSFYENLSAREFLKTYREKDMLKGKPVSFIKNGREIKATATGITDDFALTVSYDGKTETIISGEISAASPK